MTKRGLRKQEIMGDGGGSAKKMMFQDLKHHFQLGIFGEYDYMRVVKLPLKLILAASCSAALAALAAMLASLHFSSERNIP